MSAYAKVMGITDSEHMAGLFFTILSEQPRPDGKPWGTDAWTAQHPIETLVTMFDLTLKTLLNLQRIIRDADKRDPSSLNMCVTDGERMVAVRFRSHKVQDPPSLYWTEEAGVALNRKFEGTPNNVSTNVSDSTRSDLPHVADHQTHGVETSVRGTPYGTSGKKASEHGRHLIIASEPTTKMEVAKWHVVKKNSYVIQDVGIPVQLKDVGFDWQKELYY